MTIALRELIARVARSQAPVHITGESGTGKELVARLIHDSGARARCAVRTGQLRRHSLGADGERTVWPQARQFHRRRGDKPGLVQGAEGGTLFLDEVADLPLHMQVKLLRLIQEKTVRPIGEQRELPVDVRVLSATHKHLAELVAQGRFREGSLLPHQCDRDPGAGTARARAGHPATRRCDAAAAVGAHLCANAQRHHA
jgi:two-component system response regulator PilR (NtrC family)